MALAIRVDGLDSDGVPLLAPTRVEFDEVARPLLGERIADIGLKLKPMLVVVSNRSPQTIVSLSLVWDVTHQGGRVHRAWGHTSFPDAICGDGALGHNPAALPPGGQRVEANGLVIHGYGDGDPYYDQFLGQFVEKKDALLAGAVDLHIELNGVIFADGTLVGADDESRLSELFSASLQAKQDWYRGIIDALDAGQTVADAFGPVQRFQADLTRRMTAGAVPMREQFAMLWKTQAAADAMRWRRRYSDEQIHALLKRSIRLEPFVIRRR